MENMTLRVRVEVVPFGVESNARTLAVIDIANIGTAGGIADYVVHPEIAGRQLPELEVAKHRRADGWLRLVKLALAKISDEEGTVTRGTEP